MRTGPPIVAHDVAQTTGPRSLCGQSEVGASSAMLSQHWPFLWLPNSPPAHHRLQMASALASPSCFLSLCPLMSRFGPLLAETLQKPGSTLSTRNQCLAPPPCKAAAQDQRSESRAWSHSKEEWIA